MTRLAKFLWVAVVTLSATAIIPIGSASAAGSNYAQVGAQSNDSSDYYAVGFQTHLGHFAVPQSEPSGATTYVYFWVGSFLSDGSFYQSGLATRVNGCNSMQVFAQGFNPDGTLALSSFQYCGTTIATYAAFHSTHYGTTSGGADQWTSDGPAGFTPASSFYNHAPDIGTHKPLAVAELQSTGVITSANQLGYEGFGNALETKFGANWYATSTANAYFAYPYGTCPPFNVAKTSAHNLTVGSGFSGPCATNGGFLW